MRHIEGDRLEQSRIRLERNIDNNIPFLPHMSEDPIVDDGDDLSSVEFARHNSRQHPSFHSFEHPSHLDSDFYSRHGDDDSIALDPDLGHTMSTAAHHASALTLSAGLRGRADHNQTDGRASPSGAEYDPDRPLQAMLGNHITDGISLFNASARTQSKSKSLKHDQTRTLPTFDPVIVDSTAELDRFLRTGHHRPAAAPSGLPYPYVSRSHSQPGPSASDASDSDTSNPRLSQALGRHFSPKRPRSAPVPAPADRTRLSPPPRPINPTPSQTVHTLKPGKPKPGPSKLNPTAKFQHKQTIGDQVVPAPDSQFSQLARGLARDIEAQSRLLSHDHNKDQDETPRPHRQTVFLSAPAPANIFPSTLAPTSGKRPLFSNVVNKMHGNTKHGHGSTKIHLPDVTGLTSAVQSPIKCRAAYASAEAHPSLAADLLPALDALETRLQALELENGVSRRRVRELELELEECKAEVIKERTHVWERGRAEDRERERERKMHGKVREEESRYREVVEEKKALEALISTLRTNLSRLTMELASHQSLISGLRVLRDTDARETRAEVETLRKEIDRLAGEVERLKEVVEEGLRERRRAREESEGSVREDVEVPGQLGIDLTYVTAPRDMEKELPALDGEVPITVEDLEPEPEPEYEQKSGSEQAFEHEPEHVSSRTQRYIQAMELARVESEMQERRSERSRLASKSSASAQSGANDSGNGSSLNEVESVATNRDRDPSPASSPARSSVLPVRSQAPNRFASNQYMPPRQPSPSTPFPQIRGLRMERLFFSVPEHNTQTCTVCHRRKRGRERHAEPSWTRKNHLSEQDENQGVGEKEEEVVRTYLRKKTQHKKGRENPIQMSDNMDDENRLPPQTVLARVVRELEDDFTHYKAIYLELAEQYGVMDSASNVAKRNVLADHLREVIDTLEQKGDQIASLYDLLNFQDKPTPQTSLPNSKHAAFV